VLRQLRSVRKSLSRESLTSLVVDLVLARLDYCNAVLFYAELDRLQSVIKTSVRLIFSSHRRNHVTPPLVHERMDYKLCVLVCRCQPAKTTWHRPTAGQRLSTGVRRRIKAAAPLKQLSLPSQGRARLWGIVRSLSSLPAHGTHCWTVSLQHRCFSLFVECLQLIYFAAPVTTATDFN
jgi:hypothetical protein